MTPLEILIAVTACFGLVKLIGWLFGDDDGAEQNEVEGGGKCIK